MYPNIVSTIHYESENIYPTNNDQYRIEYLKIIIKVAKFARKFTL